jgi:NTE family protein
MPTSYPFRNLVFQGGGIKAFAYHGALQVLEEYGVLKQIDRVAGTSAGAIMATLLSFRLDADETIELYNTVDYSRIAEVREDLDLPERIPRALERELGKLKGGVGIATRFLRRYGLYANDYAHNWLMETIADHCGGNGRATFSEFRQRGFRDVYIVATNLSTHRATVFSAETTPHTAVADATLMSGSIPFYFEAPLFDGEQLGEGDYYVDGGVLSNYPLHIFDDPRFERGNRYFEHGVNWETLGCRLFTPQDCLLQSKPINNLIDYIENLIETIAEVQVVAFENSFVDQLRTISISNCGVATTDFSITPDKSDPKYVALVETGKAATRDYLEKYRRSSDRLFALKEKLAALLDLWD